MQLGNDNTYIKRVGSKVFELFLFGSGPPPLDQNPGSWFGLDHNVHFVAMTHSLRG